MLVPEQSVAPPEANPETPPGKKWVYDELKRICETVLQEKYRNLYNHMKARGIVYKLAKEIEEGKVSAADDAEVARLFVERMEKYLDESPPIQY